MDSEIKMEESGQEEAPAARLNRSHSKKGQDARAPLETSKEKQVAAGVCC
jgi:hypothetical protein